jgi:eukaryotic-like serine/threonine-protein kinase
MELSAGTRLGPYEIVSPIGAGGMGAVYRAHDSRLGRDVAIKVSAAEFTERFGREARAVAALNHPHICTLYDVGPNYLVMELIEGHSPRSPLPIDEAVKYASHIADALETAHAKGIIHRDIKPANVMVTARGEAKVLDFGLAQFHSQKAGDDATTLMLTAAGSALGTVAYMSPEQARGEAVDGRTDIWALGVILYEMVTGARPFQGAAQASVFDAILNRTATAPSLLNPAVSPALEQVILKATQKNRTLRYPTAADMLADLRQLQRHGTATSASVTAPSIVPPASAAAPPATKPAPPARRYIAAVAIVVVVVAVAAAAFLKLRPAKFVLADRADWQQLTNFTDTATDPALSPDGRMLAFKRGGSWFLDQGQIYVKILPDGQAVQLTHDGQAKMAPVFSPDGARIAYSADDNGWATWEVPVLAGGEPRRMLVNAEGLRWIDPRHILFSRIKAAPQMVVAVSEESLAGMREVYAPVSHYGMAHFSVASPDRKQMLIVEMEANWMPCRVVPFDGSSKSKPVGPVPSSCTAAAWSPDGKWMYFTANTGQGSHLWRQKSDGGRAEQLSKGPTTEQGIAMAADGRSLITSVGTTHSSVWIHDAKGDRQISLEGNAGSPWFSPDGMHVFYLAGQIGGIDEMSLRDTGLWMADLNSGSVTPILPGVLMARYAISPDGRAVAWSTDEGSTGDGGLWYAPLDQRTPPQNLVKGGVLMVSGIGATGNIYYIAREGQGFSTYRIAPDGTGVLRVGEASGDKLGGATISPDEQWLVAGAGERYAPSLTAHSLKSDKKVALCDDCMFVWSPGGKSVAVTLFARLGGRSQGVTGVIPLSGKTMLPPLPPEGIKSATDMEKLPGARTISYEGASPGPAGSYTFSKAESLANLYRIPLR